MPFVSGLGESEDKPDFSGTWVLDLAASESLDALLAAQGKSWPVRKLAGSMQVTQKITQTATTLTIEMEGALADRTEIMKLDGSWENKTAGTTGPGRTRTYWAPDGKNLVTESIVTLENGDNATMSAKRTLRDNGKTLVQRISLTLKDGNTLSANRILRKK